MAIEDNTPYQRHQNEEKFTLRERMSGAINALSISPEGNAVAIAGRESKSTEATEFTKTYFYFSFEGHFNS
jgi:hypothetical protein